MTRQPIVQPIVIGVDGSAHNEPAIAWAIDDSVRRGRPLTIVCAAREYIQPVPSWPARVELFELDPLARDTLSELKDEVNARHPDLAVATELKEGDASHVLLALAPSAEQVVVGKRGVGALSRIFVGSTSIAVAGRSPVPTVVVPDGWTTADEAAPIVVGVDTRDTRATLEFAFARADLLGAPLVAVQAWDGHPAIAMDDHDLRAWGDAAKDLVEADVAPWRDKYPNVHVVVTERQSHPVDALLDSAALAQLLVLGRHTASLRATGFALGSVSRAVLHYSTCPVAIVPEADPRD